MSGDVERFAPLAEVAEALAGELDLDGVLQRITDSAAHATGATYAALGVIGPDETISRFITHGADEVTIEAIDHYPRGQGLLGLLIRDPQILRLDDLRTHPASSGFPAHHPPMTSFLGGPVRSGGEVFGNLYLTDKPGGFDQTDEAILRVLSAQAGAAIDNTRLSTRLRQLAVHEERDRISRELHDGVIQTLFSIGMGLESARALVGVDPSRVAERLETAIESVDTAIRDLRGAIYHLRLQQAATHGLTNGLVELAREHEGNARTRPRLDLASGIDTQVPATAVPDVLAVVREALTNVAKHAPDAAVTVTAHFHDDTVQIEVADEGGGFDLANAQIGRGLQTMRERAAALAGTLDIHTAPGSGTRIQLHVPTEEAA